MDENNAVCFLLGFTVCVTVLGSNGTGIPDFGFCRFFFQEETHFELYWHGWTMSLGLSMLQY